MDQNVIFTQERPRLVRIATQVLGDAAEAEDVVQDAWLRLDRNTTDLTNLPGWLTTVTTRLCLDRLRARQPIPVESIEPDEFDAATTDPAESVALSDAVGVALHVVLDRLTPNERVAFVLHDSFGIDFETVAAILGNSSPAARKLASRARAKVTLTDAQGQADWQIVDAFLDAARGGDLGRLLGLLAPDAYVAGDAAAVAAGTPARIDGRQAVAAMFNGAAKAALPVFIEQRPGAAWFHRGQARVAFDFTISDGIVTSIRFRAEPELLAQVVRRRDDALTG